MEKSYFWWFCWLGLGNPCYIATKTPLEKLHQNLGLADPHPPQLGQKTKFFDRFNLKASLTKGLNFSISKSSLFDSMPYQSSVKSLSSPLFWIPPRSCQLIDLHLFFKSKANVEYLGMISIYIGVHLSGLCVQRRRWFGFWKSRLTSQRVPRHDLLSLMTLAYEGLIVMFNI